jgi:cell division protein ZipA
MELDVQDWLILIGALLIVGVLLDAWRRLRNERRNPIRMPRGTLGPGDGFRERGGEADLPGSELPSGGARVVTRDDGVVEAPRAPRARAPRAERTERRVEPRLEPAPPRPAPAAVAAAPAPAPVPVPEAAPAAVPRAEPAARAAPPDDVVQIRVIARAEGGFAGKDILRIFKECDVRFGDMRIFHRHEEAKGQGPVQFSVVNVVEPGNFDIDAMDGFSTPGLGFFMRLPGPRKPLEAFDCMLETARAIARYLDGELRDESNSVFTAQTGEHCRQRIREFARTRR